MYQEYRSSVNPVVDDEVVNEDMDPKAERESLLAIVDLVLDSSLLALASSMYPAEELSFFMRRGDLLRCVGNDVERGGVFVEGESMHVDIVDVDANDDDEDGSVR